MSTFRLRPSLPHGVSLVVWLALGFTATAWILRAQGAGSVAPTPASASVQRQDPDNALVAKALGGIPAITGNTAAGNVSLDKSRFVLAGVIAQGQGKGAALIAIDGKPAQPVAVGATVVDGWLLSKVERQSAWMAPDKGQGEALQLLLVPADSKKPLTVTGVSPPQGLSPELTRPAAAPLPAPGLVPGGSTATIKSALSGAAAESVRGTAVQAEVATPNKGN